MLIHSHQARLQIPLHLPNWRSTAAKWSFGRNHHSTPKDIQSASSDRSGNSCERWYASCFRVRWIRTRPDSIISAWDISILCEWSRGFGRRKNVRNKKRASQVCEKNWFKCVCNIPR